MTIENCLLISTVADSNKYGSADQICLWFSIKKNKNKNNKSLNFLPYEKYQL